MFSAGGGVSRRGAKARAERFANAHFSGCEANLREAMGVHRAVERLLGRQHPDLDPEATVAALLSQTRGLGAIPQGIDPLQVARHLAVAQFLMSLKQDLRATRVPDTGEAVAEAWGAAVLRVLLGPAARHSMWAGETIWMRSVRGVINERVRWSGDCVCAYGEDRPAMR